MPVEREPFLPPQQNARLIDQVASEVEPDDERWTHSFGQYLSDHRSRLAFDLELIQSHIPRDALILEYGSVPLLLTGALKKLGYDVQGLDIYPERFSSAIRTLGITVLKCDIEHERVPIDDDSVKAVLFNELFEHLRINPIFTMREVYRVMRSGGVLLLSTPNLRSLAGLAHLLLRNEAYSCSRGIYEQYEKLDTIGHMGHVREYTAKEVANFLSRIGFEIEETIYRGTFRSRLYHTLLWMTPSLSPFFSLVARKP